MKYPITYLALGAALLAGAVMTTSFARADEAPKACTLTEATAMSNLTRAAGGLPAVLTVMDGEQATTFIAGMNILQSQMVFVGDKIAIISFVNDDIVQVSVFKDGCRTYQSRSLTKDEWTAVVKAVMNVTKTDGSKPV